MRAAHYRVIGVAPGRIVEVERKRPGAPTEAWMIEWAKQRGCLFVGRYYPTRKGWCALKIDTAVKVSFGTRGQGWKGYSRGRRVYPNEGAMAMHLMCLLGVAP